MEPEFQPPFLQGDPYINTVLYRFVELSGCIHAESASVFPYFWGQQKPFDNGHLIFRTMYFPINLPEKSLNKLISGIFRDPQQRNPLAILFPYHSHKNPSRYGNSMGSLPKGVPIIGSPWNHPWTDASYFSAIIFYQMNFCNASVLRATIQKTSPRFNRRGLSLVAYVSGSEIQAFVSFVKIEHTWRIIPVSK